MTAADDNDGVSWLGVSAILIFYLVILVIGILAGWFKTRKGSRHSTEGATQNELAIVAGRDIGVVVGIFTMIATWVGGGYINGTAEVVFRDGLLNAQAPVGYAISLIVGGLLFAKTMRERRYLTMIDPFQERYGVYIGGLMYLPALFGELLWSAAVLNALGATVAVVVGLNGNLAVIISACFAILYTFVGGQYSVAYTDVAQLICIVLGLVIAIPFAWSSKYVDVNFNQTIVTGDSSYPRWLGTIPSDAVGSYVDTFLLLIFGGMPWQVYFQRVLSAKSARQAQVVSLVAGVGCLVLSIPPIFIGFIAQGVTCNNSYTDGHFTIDQAPSVLPQVLRYLTNGPVMFLGLGSVAAGVMASTDGSILSASSMFAHNIYKGLIRRSCFLCFLELLSACFSLRFILSGSLVFCSITYACKASDAETVWVLRLTVIVVGGLSCFIAIESPSVYALFTICSDLVYVLLFPQLVCVIYVRMVNSYGVLAGFSVGLISRLLVGEKSLDFPAAIAVSSNVPVKTICMLINFAVTLVVSFAANWLILGRENLRWDYLNAFERHKEQKKSIDWQEMWNSERDRTKSAGVSSRRESSRSTVRPVSPGSSAF